MGPMWAAVFPASFLALTCGWAQTLTFLPPVTYPAQNGPLATATADFNADGKPDLAVGNAASSSISIFLGKGDGTFTAGAVVTLPVTCAVSYVAAADFNADGKADLLAACGFQGALWTLPGQGNGQFGTPRQTRIPQPQLIYQGFAVEAYFAGIAAGDFTGDGKADVAVIVGPDFGSNAPLQAGNSVELLAGNGDGTFQAPTAVLNDPAALYVSLAAGDLNRDGKLDLVVSWARSTGANLSILLGDGEGAFRTAASYTSADLPYGLAIGDLNADGIPDVVHAGPTVSDIGVVMNSTVSVLRGNGDGTFRPGFTAAESGVFVGGVQLADFRGTGKPDLIEAGLTRSSLELELRPNNGDGTFASPSTVAWSGSGVAWWVSVVTGDWNGDGLPDLAVPVIDDTFVHATQPNQITDASDLANFYEHLPAGNLEVMLNALTPHNPGPGSGSNPTPKITSVVNAASFQPGIEAGSWVTIEGTLLANTNPGRTWRASEIVNGNLPTSLDGVSVTIGGKPAYVYYISPAQINVQAPTDTAQGMVNVVVTNNGAASAPAQAELQPFSPAFFLYSGTTFAIASRYPDYALLGDPAVIPGTTPAKPGDVLILWATGLGATTPPEPAGVTVAGAPSDTVTPGVTVGGVQAQVLGAALAPGSAGLYQIAIQLPQSLPDGKLAVQATVGGFQSATGISLDVAGQ